LEGEEMEGIIRLRLLGAVQVEQAGEPVRGFRSRKALALLGYLAVQGQPAPRERLIDLLWEDKTESRGRANLSWVLGRISSLLPDLLQADRHTVHFQPTVPYWLDIDAFKELEAEGSPASLESAVELYGGELLEGLHFQGCAEFELWVAGEREWWRQRVIAVLRELVGHYRRRGEYDEGLRFAQEVLALEPWREEAHRQVMQLLAWTGQRGAALAQYESCRQALLDELDVEPAAETEMVYQQIRDGELDIPVSPSHFPAKRPLFLDKEGPAEPPVFVGRENELARLDGYLARALAGEGLVVFVVGNAGQGKTALMQEFVRRAQATYPDLVVAGGSGNAHTGMGDPYLPFREILSLLSGDIQARWAAGAMSKDQASRLWQTLPLAAAALVETGPDLIDLFVRGGALFERATRAAPNEADWLPQLRRLVVRKAASPPDPSLQQSALFDQYTRVLETLARSRPLVLVLDDLQWADAGSTSLLFHLGRRIEGSRILVVGAYRPEEVALRRESKRHALQPVVNELKRHFGDIVVDLGRADGRQFVEAFLDTEPNRLDDAFRETLYRQTRGHPLFTVELLRGMQERGDLVQDREGRWVKGTALDWETLPPRVEAVIAERIGRLPKGLQDALTLASVEGETFTAEVVAEVRGIDEQEVVGSLSGELGRRHRLVKAQGIVHADGQCRSLYRFRHILFQKYLYSSLDRVEQAYLHRAVGTALEALYGEGTNEIALQLARHFQQAGIADKAVDYLREAGERAVRMSAHEEAIAHFSRGLEVLETLPETPARDQQELALRVGLGVSLQATRGYGAPEVGRTYARAYELCRQASNRGLVRGMGGMPQPFPVLGLLLMFYSVHGEHHKADEIAEQLLELAEQAEDPLLVAVARWQRGVESLYLGEFAEARAHLEKVIAFYRPQEHHSLAFRYGLDPGVMSLSAISWALWALGYPEQALRRSREALALARELSHPPSLTLAYVYACTTHGFCRDWPTVQLSAEKCMQLSTDHGLQYWSTGGLLCRGSALAAQGRTEEGMVQLREGIAMARSMGTELMMPHGLVRLAEACRRAGQAQKGLAAVADALATVNRTGERFCEAEAHRLKGELLWLEGADEADVETCFLRAIEVARRQRATSWELRAVMSMSRLWQEQGKEQEARRLLADAYDRFTEGFETPDLQEARSLLEALSGES
jgi:predicted ATPase/DNA-binding SARP family transcriptional activator